MIEKFADEFRKKDFKVFERWLNRYVTNWAHCDHISPHIIGELVGRFPELHKDVFEWTKSKNRWVRRAAAVTYVIHGRKGRFHRQIFRTAEAMMGDADEMVQKGVGWMLKEASNADEDAVVKFLLRRTKRTSRLVLRYATEKVSAANRKLVLSG
jgi:3-methyladenine DNA glycosylase AlkD